MFPKVEKETTEKVGNRKESLIFFFFFFCLLDRLTLPERDGAHKTKDENIMNWCQKQTKIYSKIINWAISLQFI